MSSPGWHPRELCCSGSGPGPPVRSAHNRRGQPGHSHSPDGRGRRDRSRLHETLVNGDSLLTASPATTSSVEKVVPAPTCDPSAPRLFVWKEMASVLRANPVRVDEEPTHGGLTERDRRGVSAVDLTEADLGSGKSTQGSAERSASSVNQTLAAHNGPPRSLNTPAMAGPPGRSEGPERGRVVPSRSVPRNPRST